MNYADLTGKSILLLGKTRSLNAREFETLLAIHRISLSKSFEEGVTLIVEGRMMNPMEQSESERLYELNSAPIVTIDSLEEWLCRSIEPNRLLMSLKLSRDQERLADFIQNPYITDELFFKLLKLYDWQAEGLFDNDGNRNVTAAIISRFYQDLDRNHNVQYAMSGLAHLIERYGTGELIEAIAALAPIVREMKSPNDRSLSGVLDAMALHPQTPKNILHLMLLERSSLIAQREPLVLENELLAMKEEAINILLAQNPALSQNGADRLETLYPGLIARHHPMNEVRFERLLYGFCVELGGNESLTLQMQERLFGLAEPEVLISLAMNPVVGQTILEALFADERYHPYLAANPSLPGEKLEQLAGSSNAEILGSLASNPSTPIEVLYQLGLDRRFERAVKTNPAFGKHIQTHNIGWN